MTFRILNNALGDSCLNRSKRISKSFRSMFNKVKDLVIHHAQSYVATVTLCLQPANLEFNFPEISYKEMNNFGRNNTGQKVKILKLVDIIRYYCCFTHSRDIFRVWM